jgi:hypothetical protein
LNLFALDKEGPCSETETDLHVGQIHRWDKPLFQLFDLQTRRANGLGTDSGYATAGETLEEAAQRQVHKILLAAKAALVGHEADS